MNLEQVLSDRGLTEEKLFSLYEAALREAFPAAKIDAQPPESVQVTMPGRQTFTLYAKNLWLKLRNQTTEDRIKTFEYYLRSVRTTFVESQPEPKRENVVPMIKDSRYFSNVGGSTRLIREHLAGDIWIVYALDLPDSMKTLNAETMQQLGLTIAELRPLACENLRHILPEIEYHHSDSWCLITAGGDYVASILLLDEVWEEIEGTVDGDIVVAVPSRDVLLFTGSRSKEGIQYLRYQARDIEQYGDHVISQTLLHRTGEAWKVYE